MSEIKVVQDEKGLGRDLVTITNAQIITSFNNFSGNFTYGGPNPEKKSLCVIIDDANAVKYFQDNGWSIKTTLEGESYLQIHVSYRFWDPNSENPVPTVIKRDPSTGALVALDDHTVAQLDDYRRRDGFEHCDIIFKGSPYESPMGRGVSGYLQWMQVTPHYNEVQETISRLQYKEFQGDTEEGLPF